MHPVRVSLGFARGTGFVSKMIRRLDGGMFNHVYWRFDYDPEGSQIYESHLKGGVQITPYEYLENARLMGKVTFIDEFEVSTDEIDCRLLYTACRQEHGDSYNLWQIAKYYSWIRFGFGLGDPEAGANDEKYTCNQFVVSTGRKVFKEWSGTDYTFTIEPLHRMAARLYRRMM